MKKAFSLFEIIIVTIVISIIASFSISKINDSLNKSIKLKIKSEIALIRNSIDKIKTKKILLKENSLTILDDATVNLQNSKLFSKILDFPLISTNKETKEIGKWIKLSDKSYWIFITDDEYLEFYFENNSFICKSASSLCKDYE